MNKSLIALLTDFGTEDGYVGAMKGRILSEAPQTRIIDISHNIESFNIKQAAFCLNNCYLYFPEKTVFVVVVDLGVGTARKGLFIHTAHHYFIGPDNGVFSFILAKEACRTFSISINKIPWEISPTFHGRDVFSSIAAIIARDDDISPYIKPFSEPNCFVQSKEKINEQKYRVPVIHIDHFGNVILNLSRKDFAELGNPDNLQILWNGFTLKGIRETFGNVSESELLLIWDSSDYLQIAVNGGSAAEKLGLELFNEVEMIL